MRVGADPDGARPAAARQHRLQRLPRRGCPRVPPARLGPAAEKGRPPLLFPRASKSLLLIRRTVRRYEFFGSLDGPERFSDPLRPRPAMTRVAPASIPPVSFGICRREAVAPDTRSSAAEREISWKGTCPSMDTAAVPRTPRLTAVDAAGVRPLGTDGLPAPITALHSPRAPCKRSARPDARNHSAGRLRTLVGPRRIETDEKGPRNGGLIVRNVL